MAKKQYILLPAGIANYPHISTADTTGKYADGKFKTKVNVPVAEAQETMNKIKAIADALGVEKLPFGPLNTKDSDGKVQTDNDTIVFSCKSKFKPTIFAADGKTEVTNMKERIGAGSKIRIYCELWPYDTGVSLQMKQVQVIDLVSGNSSAFDAMEGSFDPDEFETGDDEAPNGFAGDAPDI